MDISSWCYQTKIAHYAHLFAPVYDRQRERWNNNSLEICNRQRERSVHIGFIYQWSVKTSMNCHLKRMRRSRVVIDSWSSRLVTSSSVWYCSGVITEHHINSVINCRLHLPTSFLSFFYLYFPLFLVILRCRVPFPLLIKSNWGQYTVLQVLSQLVFTSLCSAVCFVFFVFLNIPVCVDMTNM